MYKKNFQYTQDSTNGFNDQPLHNPFNESGIDMNHSKILSVMSEVQTLTQNINQIDSILRKTQPNHIDSVLDDSTTPSVFDTPTTTTSSTKSPSKGVTNPFAKKPETYNTLRNSPENIEENGTSNTATTTTTKKSLSYDIFKEAASAAFSELNFGSKSAKYSKNKFIGNDELDNEDDDDFVEGDNDGVSVMKTSNKKSSFFSSSSSSNSSNTFLNGTVPPPVPATTKHASKNLEFSNQISGVFVNSSNGNFNNNLFGSNFNQVLLFFMKILLLFLFF